jgi:hypothetical protein
MKPEISFPKQNKPRRVNPTCRSGRFRSDPHRISSESDIFHKKPIGSDRIFVGFPSVGFRPGFRRNPMKSGSQSDKPLSDPIPPQSHGKISTTLKFHSQNRTILFCFENETSDSIIELFCFRIKTF